MPFANPPARFIRIPFRRRFLVPVLLTVWLSIGIRLRVADGQSICANCSACRQTSAERTRAVGAWRLGDTDNFCVCCPSNMDPAAIGRTCESLRMELAKKWLGDVAASPAWTVNRSSLWPAIYAKSARREKSWLLETTGIAPIAGPLPRALPHELTGRLVSR
jgi:hypothetical protein